MSTKPHRGYLEPVGIRKPQSECNKKSQSAQENVVERFVVPAKSGKAWTLKAGQTCKFLLDEGSQVGDVNLWNLHDTKEHFYSGKTRQIHRAHLTTGDRLWSCLPYLRPMATVIQDSLMGYTPDADGCGVHDVLGTRCDPYTLKMITGHDTELTCHQLITQAIEPFGLTDFDVHDVFNIFMCTGLDPITHEYLIKGTPAKKGDFIEIQAEMDLLVALSVCPCGDVSLACGNHVPDNLCHSMEIIIGNPSTKV